MKQFTQSNVDCYVKASSSSKPHCYYVDSDCRIVYVQCFYKEVLVMLFLVDIPFIFLFTIDDNKYIVKGIFNTFGIPKLKVRVH